MLLRVTTAAIALALLPAPCLAQAIVQPLNQSDADLLAEQVRRLGADPRNMDALLTAAELSVRLDDLSAAGAFLARAEKVMPAGARGAAIRGSILVRSERPGEALRQFAQAEAQGWPVARFAADRGLAFDLVGEQRRAQADYRVALKNSDSDEVRRRLALSLGISGKNRDALDELAPLVRRNDRGAWRARAFVLAMGGQSTEALGIAQTMMPPGSAQGLQGFFAELPRLPAVDRAFAVHFGEVRATPQRLADARLAPQFAALPPEPAPVQVAAIAPPAPARDRGKRKKEKLQVGRVTLAAVPAPVQVAAADPLPAPPAYRAPAYQSPRTAVTPSYRTADRPLSPGEQASLAAATLPSARRRDRVTPAPAPGFTLAPRSVELATATTRPAPSAGTLNAAPVARSPAGLAAATSRPVPAVSTPDIAPATRPPVQSAAVAPRPEALVPVTIAEAGATRPTPLGATTSASAAPALIVPATDGAPPSSTTAALNAGPSSLAASPPPALVGPPSATVAEAAPTTIASTETASPVATAPAATEPPPSAAVAPAAAAPEPSVQPAPQPVRVAAIAPSRISRTRADDILAKIVANLSIPASELGINGPVAGARPSRMAVKLATATKSTEPKKPAEKEDPAAKKLADRKAAADKKAAAEKKALADQAAAEKKAARAEPPRIWVQVAGGANEGDLAKAWKSVRTKAPAAMAGRQGYTTPLRATNRVLTGPFKTDAEARAYVNQLAKSGVSAFAFTSDPGQKIRRLGEK